MTVNGELYTWGCGSDGRLGHPDYGGAVYLYKESHPKKIEIL
jgi:regulator of chromosome condensation